MPAHSSDSESEYKPSPPPSPSALSFDSSAETEPSSPALSTMSIDDTSETETKAKLVCPPLTFSAMIVQANQGSMVALANPLIAGTTAAALSQLSAPGADKAAILGGMINAIEDNPETAQVYLTAALVDDSVLTSVVDRYAETIERNRLKDLQRKLDLAPYSVAITDAFDSATPTPEGIAALIKVLEYHIEMYAYILPRGSAYAPRAQALDGLILIGQRTCAAPENIKKGILDSPVLATKLGLALKKLVAEAGWPEEKKKQWGYMKRTGLAGRIEEVLEGWEDVKAACGGLVELFN